MPARPPIYMGMYDPAEYGAEKHGKPKPKQEVRTDETSTTPVQVELQIQNTEHVLTLPVQVSTTVWDVKLLMADRLGIDPASLQFVSKQGVYWREQKDCEEVRRKVQIRGIKSFERIRMDYPHPFGIIGCGHIGLRQAMIFMKYKQYNFVLFDKKPKVGGMAWWDQANTTSKLQTEWGVYHLNWDETLACPKEDYPWPSRDELLQHFQQQAEEQGILPYCRLGTHVKELTVEGKREHTTYELTLVKVDDPEQKEEKFSVSAVMLYPGNLSLPRRETYAGEDEFEGPINYAMFDEFDYNQARGKEVAIIGHGAFAVENVRTCCEFGAKKMYLVCRRKNIACPRFVSWLANQSGQPVSATLFLNAMKPMYDLVGFDPWSYYAVQSNAARTQCNIVQKARFGIGDVYFLAISWGKLEVIEDPEGVKRLSKGALHCGNGRRIEVDCILKLLGFVGDLTNDKLLKIKEMVGFWVNDDPKRYCVAEPISVMASNFGSTSFSPGAIQWAEQGMWMLHYPKDFYDKVLASGMMPRHKADGEDRPAYVVDARHGTTSMILVSGMIPFFQERGPIEGQLKVSRMWTLHPIDKFLDYCKEDWERYTKRFEAEGHTGPEFPYTKEVAHGILQDYKDECEAVLKVQAAGGRR